jgi:hypothetical protein
MANIDCITSSIERTTNMGGIAAILGRKIGGAAKDQAKQSKETSNKDDKSDKSSLGSALDGIMNMQKRVRGKSSTKSSSKE